MKRLLLCWFLILALAGCQTGDDDDAQPADDDAADDDQLDDDLADDDVDDDTVDDDATDDDSADDDAVDDDATDDDTTDDDTADDDTTDDDTSDDDSVPYWQGGEDLGPVPMDEYRPIVDQGLNEYEWEAGLAAKDALLQSESVMWVATLDVENDVYRLWHHDGELTFTRTIGDDGFEFEITDQIGPDPFPSTDPMFAAGYDAELALYENPGGIQMPEHGYAQDDPRVGWIPLDQYSYPFALERIALIFDTPNGPDLAFDTYPTHGGGGGTHGNLGILQSRTLLLLAGAGIKQGELIQRSARSTDVAPTALALVGSETTEGIDWRGHRVTRALQQWQDGEVLIDALTNPSVQGLADQVVIIAFDGLSPNELYYHYEHQGSGGWELPHFFELIDHGTFYRGGAITGWPTVSLPGHTTIGAGVYQGHHGLVANDVYDRASGDVFYFDWFIEHAAELLQNPALAMDFYLRFYEDARGLEGFFEAAHRSFGAWDLTKPGTWHNAYAACVNCMTILDADYGIYAFLELFSFLLPTAPDYDPRLYELADLSVPVQLALILSDFTHDVPKVAIASFVTTDYAGETDGPHSDFVREQLLKLDGYVGQIMDHYRDAGVYDRTAFILASDHGMELTEPGTYDNWRDHLIAANIKYRVVGSTSLLILPAMRVAPSQTELPAGVPTTFSVTVRNDDTQQPVAGATLTLTGGDCQPCTAVTDDQGEAEFTITPQLGDAVELVAAHPDFNDAVVSFEVYEP